MACTTKVLCSNLRGTRHRMTLDKSLTAVCLGSSGRCILITCDIHWLLWLVGVYEKVKRLNRGILRQAGFLSRATTSNSCRKNIRLTKLSSDRTVYRKVAERRGILSFLLSLLMSNLNALYVRRTEYYHNISKRRNTNKNIVQRKNKES